jgi:uncharacterized membrane protein
VPAARQRVLSAVVLGLAVLTAAGAAALFPYGGPPTAAQAGFDAVEEERLRGRITAVREVEGADAGGFLLPGARQVQVDVELDGGRQVVLDAVDETGAYEVGRAVEVAQVAAAGTAPTYAIVDFPRGGPLLAVAAAFAAAVIALGRWQGLRALVGLGASALVITGFLVPSLLAGRPPVAVAVVAALAVMFLTLPLSHGWSPVTQAAAAGTAVALLLTVGLALAAVELTALTGLSSEDVQLVRFTTGTAIDVRGLLLAGIVVGTLGVLDDVTVSQASTVAALRRTDPSAGEAALVREALRVGRDHIAATVNTLFLAYAGASLPLLILFSVGGAPVGETLTSELVAQELVRTAVGSIGLVLAVPLTTVVAALVAGPAPEAPAAAVPQAAVPGAAPQARADDPPGDAEGWEQALRTRYGLDGGGGDRGGR